MFSKFNNICSKIKFLLFVSISTSFLNMNVVFSCVLQDNHLNLSFKNGKLHDSLLNFTLISSTSLLSIQQTNSLNNLLLYMVYKTDASSGGQYYYCSGTKYYKSLTFVDDGTFPQNTKIPGYLPLNHLSAYMFYYRQEVSEFCGVTYLRDPFYVIDNVFYTYSLPSIVDDCNGLPKKVLYSITPIAREVNYFDQILYLNKYNISEKFCSNNHTKETFVMSNNPNKLIYSLLSFGDYYPILNLQNYSFPQCDLTCINPVNRTVLILSNPIVDWQLYTIIASSIIGFLLLLLVVYLALNLNIEYPVNI